MDPTNRLITDNSLNELAQAEYLRFDLDQQKLVDTNIIRVFFEKIKGFLGFVDTTDKNLLADKIFSYLDERHELFTQANLDQIQKLCLHAGIIQNRQAEDPLSSSQKKLAALVDEILFSIDKPSQEESNSISGRLSLTETEQQMKTQQLGNEILQNDFNLTELPEIQTNEDSQLPLIIQEDDESSTEQPLEEDASAESHAKNEENTAYQEETFYQEEALQQQIDEKESLPVSENTEIEENIVQNNILEITTPEESTLKKIAKVAIPIIGFAFAGLAAWYTNRTPFSGVSRVTPSDTDGAVSKVFSEIDFTNQIPLHPNNVKSRITSILPMNIPSLAAIQSFNDFLASPPLDVDERLLLHAVGDLFGDEDLEGGLSETMIDYFLGNIKAKMDAMRICDRNIQDKFCWQYSGTHYKELESKLKTASEIYDHFRTQDTPEFSAYLKNKISQLKPEESLFFPGGWTKHAVVYEITKQSDAKISFRTYNTGAGSEIHSRALIGLETIYLPFIERNNIAIDHFCGPVVLTCLQELIKAQAVIDPLIDSDNFNYQVLGVIGGDVSDKVYGAEDMYAAQQSGTCSYKSLLAAFSQNLKDRKEFERFTFEAEIKALNDYDKNYSDRYAESKQAFNLMQKGKTAFAVRVDQWYKKGIILSEELPIVIEVLNRIEAHLKAADQIIKQNIIQNYPILSLIPKGDSRINPVIDLWRHVPEPEPKFSTEWLRGSSLIIPSIHNWKVNPKNLAMDLKQIQNDIRHIHEVHGFKVAQEMIKEVALKLPFDDPDFWNDLDKTQAGKLVKIYSKLGEDLINSILVDATENKIDKGYLKPSDYLAMLKFLRGADETIQKCQKELGFGFPSVHQNVMDTFFDHLAVTFSVTEVEWHEEFNRLLIYWKGQKEQKNAVFNGELSDFFGLDIDHGEGAKERDPFKVKLTEEEYEKGPRIAELDWALAWLRKHPEIQQELSEVWWGWGLGDIVMAAAATIRKLHPLDNRVVSEQSVLPNEFYELRKLAVHTSNMILGTMNPRTNFSRYYGTQISGVGGTFEWKNGIGSVNIPRFGFIIYNTKNSKNSVPQRPPELNFKESTGQLSHQGITSHLFDDVKKKGNEDFIKVYPRSWYDEDFTFSSRKRLSPNQAILSLLSSQKELELDVLSLSSHVDLQIDETLGFFAAHIGRFNKPDYQDTFEYLMFDAGLLVKEMQIPIDSQLLAKKLSDFCQRGFQMYLKRQDLSGAHFFLRMNRRIDALVNQHKKESPEHFPQDFKSPFADVKSWISEMYAQKDLSRALEADLARELLSVYRDQRNLNEDDWVDFISAAIKLNTLEPHSKKQEMSSHFEASEALNHRHRDLQALKDHPKRDWIFNEVVRKITGNTSENTWEIEYPYAKSVQEGHSPPDFAIDLNYGEYYGKQQGKLTSLPEVFSQHPLFIKLFGQKDLWDALEISPQFHYEFSTAQGIPYRVFKYPGNNALFFKYQFQGKWYEQFPRNPIHIKLLDDKEVWVLKNTYVFTSKKGVPLYAIENPFSPYKIEELNVKGEKTGRVVADLDKDDPLRQFFERFEDNDYTAILLDDQTAQPLALNFLRYGLTFSVKENPKTKEWELFSDQYQGLKVAKSQGLSALDDHSNYLLLEKEVDGKIEQKVLLPLVIFAHKGSTLDIKDNRRAPFRGVHRAYLVDIDPKTGKLIPKEDLARMHLAMRYLWKQDYAEAKSYLSHFATHDHPFSQIEVEMLESIAYLNNGDRHPYAQALRYKAEALLWKNQAYFPDEKLSYKYIETKERLEKLTSYLENLEYMGEFRLTSEEEIFIYNSLSKEADLIINNFANALSPQSFGGVQAQDVLKSASKKPVYPKIHGLKMATYEWMDGLNAANMADPIAPSILKHSLLQNFAGVYEVLHKDYLASTQEIWDILIKITGMNYGLEKTNHDSLDRKKLLEIFDQILMIKMHSKNEAESRTACILYSLKNDPGKFPDPVFLRKWRSKESIFLNEELWNTLKKIDISAERDLSFDSGFSYQLTSQEAEIIPNKEIPGVCMILPETTPFGGKPVISKLEEYFESKLIKTKDHEVALCNDLQTNVFEKRVDDRFVQSKLNKINEKLEAHAEKIKNTDKTHYFISDIQKLHSLKYRLQEEKNQRDAELIILQQQIESLLNRPYDKPTKQDLKEIKISGQIDSPISFEEALRLFLQQDNQKIRLRNPALSELETTNANKLIRSYLERATYRNQINKVVEKIDPTLKLKTENAPQDELQKATDELIQLGSQRRMYSTAQHPEYLLFEYQQGILLKENQVELLDKLKIKNGKIGAPQYLGVAGEAIPGMGKTFAVLPILSLLNADGEQISINMIPESLIESMTPQMRNALKTTSGNLFERIDIDRSTRMEKEDLIMLRARLNRIREERRVLSLKPSSAYSLYLRFIEQFEMYINQAASVSEDCVNIFSDILTFFKKLGSLIIDEIDTVLDILKSFHFTTGAKIPLEDIYRDTTSSTFLYLATNKEIGEKIALGFGSYQGTEGLTEKYYHQEIKPLMIDALLAEKLSIKDPTFNDFIKNLNLSEKTILADFLSGENIIEGRKLLINKASDSVQDRFAIYFEHFNELLPLTLSKKLNEHYGRDTANEDSNLAIPYQQSNPSLGSTHGTELETAFYTAKMHLQQGISVKIVEREIERISSLILKYLENHPDKSPEEAPAYQEYLYLTGNKDIASVLKPSKNNLEAITELVNQDPKVQIYLIDRYILPEISVFPTQLNANSPAMGMFYHSIQGMTGTLGWNKETFTRFIEATYESGTTAEILELIWRDQRPVTEITLPKSTTMGREGIRKILSQIYFRKDFKPGSFIDTAAVFRDVADRADVAREMLLSDCWKDTSIKGVIFYDSHNKLKVMKFINNVVTAFDLESCGLSREELVAFWDQQHTTGSDLKVSEVGTATMSIGKDTILRDWEQSALRMRDLAKKQSLNVIVTDQDAKIIRSNIKELTGEDIDKLELKHLLFHAVTAQSERQAKENFSALKQKMDAILLEKAYSTLIDPQIPFSDKVDVYKDTRSLFADTTRVRPFDLYAQPKDKKDKEIVLQTIKERFLTGPVMKGFTRNKLLKSKFKESLIIDEVESLIAKEKGHLADQVTITANSYGKERVVKIEAQKETKKEAETEREVEKETSRATQDNQNLYTEPLQWPKDKFFTKGYFNHISNSLSDIFNRDDLPGANLIDNQLRGTKNLFPYTVHRELNDRFGLYQKNHNFILAVQDKMTEQWQVVLLDQNDAKQFKSFLTQDAINPNPREKREMRVCMYHLDAKTQHSALETISHDMFENDPELMNLIVQAKFLGGESSYSKKELPLLKTWLERNPKELFALFKHVVRFKEESRAKFIDSELEQLFKSLGVSE